LIRVRKHIAFLLFGIFFFPILFQSIHVVWHHSHTYKCEHNLCSQTITNNDIHTNGENVSEKEKTCPICAYQFAINDLSTISFFNPVIPIFICDYNEIATQHHYKKVYSDKSSRAPPVFIS
jgi:hypothetical protein